MKTPTATAHEQAQLWNGSSGRAWVEAQGVMDHMLKPFEDLLVTWTRERANARVLDIGCGTGATTVAVERPQIASEVVGIDISEPMLAAARERALREKSRATFICADVETHAFAPQSFDTLISRFGVMFFPDPIKAFRQLRGASSSGAEMKLVAWRGPTDNPFMTTAERAAAPALALAPRKPDGPGQFAFADPARVRHILESSGWSHIDIQSIDVTCSLPENQLMMYASKLGPVGKALGELEPAQRSDILATIRRAFEPFVHGDEVRFVAACWLVGARADQ